ncbi:hypothetical protein VT47_20180 [Pseudomonas syringae pv. syringae]|nr:hypothetical protein VT47_20180 [Pseudomonas syringae pv. syringae]
MLSAGEHPMWVAKQMGQTDWTMIARVYGRWMPTSTDAEGSKAVEKFKVGPTSSLEMRPVGTDERQ